MHKQKLNLNIDKDQIVKNLKPNTELLVFDSLKDLINSNLVYSKIIKKINFKEWIYYYSNKPIILEIWYRAIFNYKQVAKHYDKLEVYNYSLFEKVLNKLDWEMPHISECESIHPKYSNIFYLEASLSEGHLIVENETVKVESGDLVIFEGNKLHYTTPSKNFRVSMPFNIWTKNDFNTS